MEIVNRIIEIDRMADERISDAKIKSEEILQNAEKDSVSVRNDIVAAADKRIAEVESINKIEYDSKLAALEEKCAHEKKLMDEFFESSCEEIKNSIFAEIVGE